MILIIIPLILIVSVYADAKRDRLMDKLHNRRALFHEDWTPAQRKWHKWKWISVFSVWGLLTIIWFYYLIQYLRWYYCFIIIGSLAVFCNFMWESVYWKKDE